MRLEKLRIQHFRSYDDETVHFDAYNCLVGPNGSGKSALLAALNVLFRHSSAPFEVHALSDQDFHNLDTSEPVVITATFSDLSEAAKEDLAAYVRQDRLVLTARAEFDEAAGTAEVKQFGERLVISDFREYFERDAAGAKAAELKEVYRRIRSEYEELPEVTVKAQMEGALREFEEAHPELCTLIPSEDQFYGWTRGVNRLVRHVQWVYVPAVKHAHEEEHEGRNTALGQLLSRTVRAKVDFSESLEKVRQTAQEAYERLLQEEQEVLASLSASLQSRLREWAHPSANVELRWASESGKSVSVTEPMAKADVGEGQFLGDINRLGHGLQRTFIVTLLHALSEEGPEGSPSLILGFEEPELFQHPPQARHLASTLEALSRDDAQVILTTHSPYFVSGWGFAAVRMVQKPVGGGPTEVGGLTGAELSEELSRALGGDVRRPSEVLAAVEQIMQPSQNELFFSRVPILVEGTEDVAYLSATLHLLGRWKDFRRLGCHFVVCGGKTNMSRPLAIANGLGMPAFAVWDGDGNRTAESDVHRRDNACLLRLCEEDPDQAWPPATVRADRLVMWKEDLRREVRNEMTVRVWDRAVSRAREEYELLANIKEKNGLLITGALEQLAESHGTVPRCLEVTADQVLAFAELHFG